MPYGQQPYQVQGGYPSYMQPAGQVFYPGTFRQPANYYGQGVVTRMAGQDSVPSAQVVPSGASTFPQPTKSTPPVRQKRILRIEDPNTHEALDLKEISTRTQTKEVAPNDIKEATSEKVTEVSIDKKDTVKTILSDDNEKEIDESPAAAVEAIAAEADADHKSSPREVRLVVSTIQ